MGAGRGQTRRTQTRGGGQESFQHDMKKQCPAIPDHMLQISEALIFRKEGKHELQIGIFADISNGRENPIFHLISVLGTPHKQDGVPEIEEAAPDFGSASLRMGMQTAEAMQNGYSSENTRFSLPDSEEEVFANLEQRLRASGPFSPDQLKPITF